MFHKSFLVKLAAKHNQVITPHDILHFVNGSKSNIFLNVYRVNYNVRISKTAIVYDYMHRTVNAVMFKTGVLRS